MQTVLENLSVEFDKGLDNPTVERMSFISVLINQIVKEINAKNNYGEI